MRHCGGEARIAGLFDVLDVTGAGAVTRQELFLLLMLTSLLLLALSLRAASRKHFGEARTD